MGWFVHEAWYYDSPEEVPALVEVCESEGERRAAEEEWVAWECRNVAAVGFVGRFVWDGLGRLGRHRLTAPSAA